MPSYKLTYFPLRARGESIRLLFVQGGLEYEERVIPYMKEEWRELKHSGLPPFRQLPILEVDGVVLAQSLGIMRFIANRVGLAPSDDLERAKADMIVYGVDDVFTRFIEIYFEKDEARKAELRKAFYENYILDQLGYFENLLKTNQGGKGYFVGDSLTYADIVFFNLCNSQLADGKPEVPDTLKGFSLLVDHYNRVLNEPKILQWIKAREDSSL